MTTVKFIVDAQGLSTALWYGLRAYGRSRGEAPVMLTVSDDRVFIGAFHEGVGVNTRIPAEVAHGGNILCDGRILWKKIDTLRGPITVEVQTIDDRQWVTVNGAVIAQAETGTIEQCGAGQPDTFQEEQIPIDILLEGLRSTAYAVDRFPTSQWPRTDSLRIELGGSIRFITTDRFRAVARVFPKVTTVSGGMVHTR